MLGNEPYKNTVLKSYEGPKPWPSWLQKIDETVTRFTYRNFGWVFGMDITPSSIVPAMEPGRLISMSEYGVYYSNTDQKIDQTLFLVSALSGAANLSATNNLISKSVPAEKVNHWFNKSLNYDPPYKEGTTVKTYKLKNNTKFVRVYDGIESRMKGSFLMNPEDIKGLSAYQIQKKYALPSLPKYICDVELQKGVYVREGIANSLFGFNGGGIQYDTYVNLEQVGVFTNARLLK